METDSLFLPFEGAHGVMGGLSAIIKKYPGTNPERYIFFVNNSPGKNFKNDALVLKMLQAFSK